MERRRRETPGLAFILVADKKFRSKVAQLRAMYPDFSSVLWCALCDYVHFWAETRMECHQPVLAVADAESQPKKKQDKEKSQAQTIAGEVGRTSKSRAVVWKQAARSQP